MGSKLLNAYIIVRINALRVASAPVLTNTPKSLFPCAMQQKHFGK